MKKLLMLILSLSMATVALTSCNGFNELFESTPESSSSAPTSSVDIPEESETPSESTEDEKSEYTVTFQQAGQADVTMTVEEGSTIAEADIPTPVQEEGYTIVWKADELAQLTNISGNVTVTADKTANTYTITYNANGGTVASATQEVTYDSNVTLAVPTRDNYTFNNWTDANGKVITDGAWKIAGDVTLTANWTENGKAGITFVYADASTEAKEVYVNTALTDIPNPQAVSKTGYAVDANWYTDSACTTVADFTKVTENMTVYAKVTANTYTITYNANGGTVASTTQDVVYDSNVTLAVPTRDNYTFNNWKDASGKVITDGVWKIANDVTLTANWTENGKATITFVYADGSADDKTQVYVNEDLTNIPNPQAVSKTGYSIDANWYADSACTTVASFENITASMTVYAKATANTYTITYNANGGTVASTTQDVVYDSNVTLAVPTRDNYTFNNWKDGAGNVISNGKWTIASDVTLTANWTENEKVMVTFVYADGTTENSEYFYVGGSLTNIPATTKKLVTGYDIDENWYTDSTFTTVANFNNVSASMTVYAKKVEKTYTVQLNANGGTGAAASFNVKYGATVTLDVPSKTGYTFLGWYDGDTLVAKDTAITWTYDNANMTLTAKWQANTYTVTLNNGTTTTTMEVTFGAAYTLPTPTKEGFTFKGWTKDGIAFDAEGTWNYAMGATLVATWEENKESDGDWTQNY